MNERRRREFASRQSSGEEVQLYEKPRVRNRDRPPFSLDFNSPDPPPEHQYEAGDGRFSPAPEPVTQAEYDERPAAPKASPGDISSEERRRAFFEMRAAAAHLLVRSGLVFWILVCSEV